MQLLGEGRIRRKLEAPPTMRCRPCVFQVLSTLETASPETLAIARAVLASCGGGLSVISTMALVRSSATGALPDVRLRCPGCRHDGIRSQAFRTELHDPGAPDMLLGRIAVSGCPQADDDQHR